MCDNKGCCGCCNSGSSSQSSTENTTTQELVDKILPGFPIIMLDEDEDVEAFSEDTGWGSGVWEGWAICNGNSYTRPDKRVITTNNMMDRVPVGAGDTYEVGDQFGEDSVTLTTAKLPSHTHTLTDPGHTHVVTDPGHTHTVNDSGHTHGVTDPGHGHTVNNTLALSETVANGSRNVDTVSVDTGSDNDVPDTWDTYDVSLTGGVAIVDNTSDVTVDEAETGITNDSAEAGIELESSEAGITIANTGGGEAHENRQPSSAVLFVKRIYVAG